MEWSVHDNTELSRWVLHHRALAVHGPPASTLVPDVPPQVLRNEAAALALARRRDLAADPEYLQNAWGQPHEVLTRCRLLFSATRAEVTGRPTQPAGAEASSPRSGTTSWTTPSPYGRTRRNASISRRIPLCRAGPGSSSSS